MKTLLIIIMFLGIIVSDASAFEEGTFTSPSGDKLKVTDIKSVRKIELGGGDWEFKIAITNEDNVKSSGESFNAIIKIKSAGDIVRTKTLIIDPPQIGPGKTYTVSFSISPLVENQVIEGVFSIVMDTVQDALTGMTKEFRVPRN